MRLRYAIMIQLLLAATCFAGRVFADEADKVKARQHFRQGVESFDQRRFGNALAEFEQSYELYPAYTTLFNVGQVQVALGHPVQAIDAFEKFLSDGGASISPRQRASVEAELKAQRERVGDIKVTVEPDGAEIRVDGESVGKAPLNAVVRVAAGHHRLEAMADGYSPDHREVDVAGLGHADVSFTLQALQHEAPAGAADPAVVPVTGTLPVTPMPMAATSAARSASPPASKYANTTAAGSQQRVVGYSLAGIGLITAGVGVAIGLDGQSKHNKALNQWYAGDHPAARLTESDSSKEKTKGYAVIGVGGAVFATGAIVILSAPSHQPGRATLKWLPWVGSSVTGAAVEGTW